MKILKRTAFVFAVLLLQALNSTSTNAQILNGSGIPDFSRPQTNTPRLLEQGQIESKANGLSRWLEEKGSQQPLSQTENRPSWPNLGLFKRKDNGFGTESGFSLPRLNPDNGNQSTFWQDLTARSKNLFQRPERAEGEGFMAALKRGNENLKQRFASWENLTRGNKKPFSWLRDSSDSDGLVTGFEQDAETIRNNIRRAAQNFNAQHPNLQPPNLQQAQPPLRSADNLERTFKKRF